MARIARNELGGHRACAAFAAGEHDAHQAIACVADPLQVSAVSGDGLVEGLEDPSRRFYLGVQWHPEYLDNNVPLFEALVAAAK